MSSKLIDISRLWLPTRKQQAQQVVQSDNIKFSLRAYRWMMLHGVEVRLLYALTTDSTAAGDCWEHWWLK